MREARSKDKLGITLGKGKKCFRQHTEQEAAGQFNYLKTVSGAKPKEARGREEWN